MINLIQKVVTFQIRIGLSMKSLEYEVGLGYELLNLNLDMS